LISKRDVIACLIGFAIGLSLMLVINLTTHRPRIPMHQNQMRNVEIRNNNKSNKQSIKEKKTRTAKNNTTTTTTTKTTTK